MINFKKEVRIKSASELKKPKNFYISKNSLAFCVRVKLISIPIVVLSASVTTSLCICDFKAKIKTNACQHIGFYMNIYDCD